MPELRLFVNTDDLVRQMTAIMSYGATPRYKHELDALVEFVGMLDDEIMDSEFTERVYKMFRDRMEDVDYHANRSLD
jgi:hypothetical protein